jgi:WD40 repeat protein
MPLLDSKSSTDALTQAAAEVTALNIRVPIALSCLYLAGCFHGGDSPEESFAVAQAGLYSATLSPEGRFLIAGSLNHGGSQWQLWPPERHFNWNHKTDTNSLILASDVSADLNYAVTADNRQMVLWAMNTGEPQGFWQALADIESVSLSPDASLALVSQTNDQATLFDIQQGGIQHTFAHSDTVNCSIFSPDGLVAITASDDSTVKLWSTTSGQLLSSLQHGTDVRTLAINPTGHTLFSSSVREPGRLWDMASGKLIQALDAPAGYYSSARFNHTGAQLLLGSSDGKVILWHLKTPNKVREWLVTPPGWGNTRARVLDVAFTNKGWLAVDASGQVHRLE